MNQVNWGIIGCGDVTEVKSGPAFNKVENSRLIAVMRRNAQKAKDYAKRHGVPRWYSDANDLINDPDVNAIYVATPPLYHEEYTIAALKAGKPVYVEKPMTMTSEAAIRMYEAANQTGTKLTVAHYRRGMPIFNRIKRLLDSKAIGEVRLVSMQMLQPHQTEIIAKTEENWRLDPTVSGGGLFHDLAPHQLDLMIYFFGDVERAGGISTNQGRYYAADDFVSGEILFKNNVVFNGVWSFTVPESETRDRCEIIGTAGKLSFSVFGYDLTITKDGQEERIEFLREQHVQQPMIQQVVNYFLGRGANPCSASEGVKVMQLMDAFTQSNSVAHEVNFKRF